MVSQDVHKTELSELNGLAQLISGGNYEFENEISTTVPVVQFKLANALIYQKISVLDGDIIYFTTTSEIDQGETLINYIAFSLEVE